MYLQPAVSQQTTIFPETHLVKEPVIIVLVSVESTAHEFHFAARIGYIGAESSPRGVVAHATAFKLEKHFCFVRVNNSLHCVLHTLKAVLKGNR